MKRAPGAGFNAGMLHAFYVIGTKPVAMAFPATHPNQIIKIAPTPEDFHE